MRTYSVGGWWKRLPLVAMLAAAMLFAVACGDDADGSEGNGGSDAVLKIGGIPDQDVSALEAQFGLIADYLSDTLDMPVEYVAANDYAAIVTAFQRGDVHLAWFGGLTGVQARDQLPESEAIAQRVTDAEFHSVFIVGENVEAQSLEDLAGLTFTFGSESSTSGHLMPRAFLTDAGVDPESDFPGGPGYSGSHDQTYQLVESGAYQAGALNAAVWESAVANGRVDTSKVRVMLESPSYTDYNWTVRNDVDDTFGEGTIDRIREALLGVAESDHEAAAGIMETFGGGAPGGFIAASNGDYDTIREIAESLGIIR